MVDYNGEGPPVAYSKFSPKVEPADLLTGSIHAREGTITLTGKKGDDLSGAVMRRLLFPGLPGAYQAPGDVEDCVFRTFRAARMRLAFSVNEDEGGLRIA